MQPGTYAEAIVLPGHDLVLRGAGPAVAILDAQGLPTSTDRVITAPFAFEGVAP